MALEMTIYSEDNLVGDKPYCRDDMLRALSDEASQFVEKAITLAKRTTSIIQIIQSETEIRVKMIVPHGGFLGSMNKTLGELFLMSQDSLILPLSEENTFAFSINLYYKYKSTE